MRISFFSAVAVFLYGFFVHGCALAAPSITAEVDKTGISNDEVITYKATVFLR